nr:H519 [uncultured bacterium]
MPNEGKDINVTTKVLDDGQAEKFKISEKASLLDVMQEGASRGGVSLLPTAEAPLDTFHNIGKHNEVGPIIEDLQQTLDEFLDGDHGHGHGGHGSDDEKKKPDFGIRLVRAIRVNTRWAVATAAAMTPRDILALPGINLDYQQYTLYLPSSSEPLPLDVPVPTERGAVFEAQKDGRYGGR